MSTKKKRSVKTKSLFEKEPLVPVKDETSDENLSSELNEPRWSVVTFDESAANHLTYAAAVQKMAEFEAAGLSGLCIVTDETAARIRKNDNNEQ